jgi:hypothetical protein
MPSWRFFFYEFQEFQELKKKKAGDSSFCGGQKELA